MTWMRIACGLICGLSLGACATSFTGSAYIEGGRAMCEQKCTGQGLAMTGLVYMGEYSSACVCSVPGAGGGTAAATASVTSGAAGVIMQMQQNEQQQQTRLATY